ncbi:metallophosphoesterase [Streptomyces radicis]|uniref:Metallophosphoesterase n=1 Tax=Streptomyces radicis TaxID=1750517 RepID=A0A3A9VWB5_9ACTN|nr:metallophosphoesterase [Streptomyces radicis]RKN05218.1 metallophosphoesterase [Streptomyces radicis]RKN16751.1 metallophosphoesterase [Streptomyces radicis]
MGVLIVIPLAVVTVVLGAAHWYLWKRLVRDVSAPGSRYRTVGAVALGVLPVLAVFSFTGREMGVPFDVQRVTAWPGYHWMIALLYLLLTLGAAELVRPLVLRVLRRRARGRAVEEPEPVSEPVPVAAGVAATDEAPGGSTGGSTAGAKDPAESAAGEGGAAGERAGGEGDEGGKGDGGAEAEGAKGRREGKAPDDPAELSRRLLVSRAAAVTAGVVAAGALGYGSWAARNLRTKHVAVPLAKLPRAAHGYRVAVVSDIHLGPLMGRSHCQRVVDTINRAQPDLITVVGDMVDAEVADLRTAVAPLAQLSARDGAYFVTGNHEYFVEGTAEWLDHVRELGLRPLENARDELPHFDLAGVNDLAGEGTEGGGPDFDAALGDRDPRRASILMSHQPVTIHDAVDHGVDLQLSGHTHGGQVWPITYLAALANPTLAGLERYGDTQLYVTRGAGAWGPPVRIGADPDVTIITLESGQS